LVPQFASLSNKGENDASPIFNRLRAHNMSDSNLFLCFYGDGPFWKDLLYVPAYPAGFSYQKWAFRYDPSKWVSAALQAEVSKQAQKKIELPGILGVRFSKSRPELVLPLRRIEVTWFDLSDGIDQFYFRVQALLDFSKFSSLEQACLTLPAEEVADGGQAKNALAFRSAVNVDALKWASPDMEGTAWSRLLDLIRANTVVPLRVDVKSGVYLRFSNVLDAKNRTLKATELETSPGKGPIYGMHLKEGGEYQIKLSHRILSEEHEETATAPILPIKMELPTTHLQLTQPTLEVLGWYQTTPIVFKAVQSDQAHQVLLIRADKKKKTSADGKTEDVDADADAYLPIPLKVGIGWFYRFRTNWLLRIGLAVVLTIQAAIAYLKEFLDKFLKGKATLGDLIDFWPILLILFVLGAVASIFVTMLSGQPKLKD
jgi:hypothetical protein